MKKLNIDPNEGIAEKEYEKFLTEYGFKLVLDEDRKDSFYSVFQNDEILLAFTFQRHMGENLAVAELGSPINADSIAARKDGWSLIGEVWEDAYKDHVKAMQELPDPHELSRQQKVMLFDKTLRTFMDKIRSGEVSISHPEYRMEKGGL